jgi:hypothetical protein
VLPPTEHLRDYYAILGIDGNASEDEIRRAYRAKARQLHPDVGGTSDEMKLLNEAYEVLSDPASRKAHDRELVTRYWEQDTARAQALESDSATISTERQSPELRWLIGRAICSLLLGLACFAESGNRLLAPHAFYAWLIRGVALFFVLLGAAMLYTSHRVNQVRSEPLSPDRAHIRIYRLTFRLSLLALIILLIALSLFLQR